MFPLLQLADRLMPMERNFQTKEFKIAGWSSNLLENASGEVKYLDVVICFTVRLLFKTLLINKLNTDEHGFLLHVNMSDTAGWLVYGTIMHPLTLSLLIHSNLRIAW